MKKKLTIYQAEGIAHRLIGTSNSLDDELHELGFEYGDISLEACGIIDSFAMECHTCGYWFKSEEAPENECMECRKESK